MHKKNILAIGFNAGGNPFCPVYSTPEDFDMPDPAKAFAGDAGYGWLEGRGYDMYPVFFARARGRMTLETYEAMLERLFSVIPRDRSFDGVYLQIGGGMLVDFIGNGDAFFVSRLRERLGYAVPMAAPMDFHGGMPYTLMKCLNIITTFRTNPHVDAPQTQLRAARLLDRAIREQRTPHNIAVRVPLVVADSMKQEAGAGLAVNHLLDQLELLDRVWSASFMTGSAWSNSANTGSLLVVSCDGVTHELREAMKAAAVEIWDIKDTYVPINQVVGPEEAFLLADRLSENGTKKSPIFIDDSGDNPTNSATGDSAFMLALALRMHQKDILFAGIWDKSFVDAAVKAGLNQTVSTEIGASVDPAGTRIPVTGIIQSFRRDTSGDITGVKVCIDNITVLVTSSREGVLNRSFMESFDEDCMNYKKIVVKLGYLLDDFLKIASDVFVAASPGNVDLDFDRINGAMDQIPRPMYPFDGDFAFMPVVVE